MTAVNAPRPRRQSRQVRTQPYRILVASNAEAASLGAIRLAAAIARRRSASVHALIVTTPFPHMLPNPFVIAPPAMLDDDSRRSAIQALRDQLAGVRGTRRWTMRATTGFASDSIIDAARRWPASLVVMGTGEHGLFDRLIGSETAIKVATQIDVPMLAVPQGATALPTHTVAAVDFSDASINAARLAASLLGHKGTLTLLYASPLIVDAAISGSLTDLYTTGARDRLEEIAGEIRRRSRRSVDVTLASGTVVDRLLAYVDRKQCDMIALGSHEPSLLERLIVGRVRSQVLRLAPCSVLISPARKEVR